MVDGRGTGSLVSLTGQRDEHTHTDRHSTDKTDRSCFCRTRAPGHATRCTCGRRPGSSYCVPLPHAGRCPFPTYPFPMLVLVYLQGPMLPALPTDSNNALRLLYICPQPASACIGPSFPLPKYCPTFDCAFLNLVGSVIPKVRSTRVTVLLLLLRCRAAARQTGGAAALHGSPPLSLLYLVP